MLYYFLTQYCCTVEASPQGLVSHVCSNEVQFCRVPIIGNDIVLYGHKQSFSMNPVISVYKNKSGKE